jgi:hypothetical protein
MLGGGVEHISGSVNHQCMICLTRRRGGIHPGKEFGERGYQVTITINYR